MGGEGNYILLLNLSVLLVTHLACLFTLACVKKATAAVVDSVWDADTTVPPAPAVLRRQVCCLEWVTPAGLQILQ